MLLKSLEFLQIYLNGIDGLGVASPLEVSNFLGRRGHSFRKYFKELLLDSYIEEFGSSWPRTYTITNKGKNLLKHYDVLLSDAETL